MVPTWCHGHARCITAAPHWLGLPYVRFSSLSTMQHAQEEGGHGALVQRSGKSLSAALGASAVRRSAKSVSAAAGVEVRAHGLLSWLCVTIVVRDTWGRGLRGQFVIDAARVAIMIRLLPWLRLAGPVSMHTQQLL